MVGILVKEGACAAVVTRHALFNDNARHADGPLSTSSIMAEVLSGTLARCGSRDGDAAGVGGGGSHGNRQLGLASTGGMGCITAALVCADLVVRLTCRTRRPFSAALDLRNSVTATARSRGDGMSAETNLAAAAECAGLGDAFAHAIRRRHGTRRAHRLVAALCRLLVAVQTRTGAALATRVGNSV